jgi:hypothetical protein
MTKWDRAPEQLDRAQKSRGRPWCDMAVVRYVLPPGIDDWAPLMVCNGIVLSSHD